MVRYEVKNELNANEDKNVILEIEEEFSGTLLNGLNIYVMDASNDDLIANMSLSYIEVLELYKMLSEKICNTQIQMVKMKDKRLRECKNTKIKQYIDEDGNTYFAGLEV